MRRSGSIPIDRRIRFVFCALVFAFAVASATAAPAPVPSPLRDAWGIASVFYPEVAAEPGAVVFFETHQLSVASMKRAADDAGWNFAGPFRLGVQRAAGARSRPLMVEAEVVTDSGGRLRSFSLGACELYDPSGLYALSKELTDHHAGPEEVDRQLLARFATFPPSRLQHAEREFRDKFSAASTILGQISISDVHFGASYTRDPLDETVELHWLVTGSRGNDRVVALFEPFQGKLVSLEFH